MLINLLLTLSSSLVFGSSCLDARFCSTGEAPRFILCSRGHDCSKAIDLGMNFSKDCTASWWLGDAQMMKKYKIENDVITILKNSWDESDHDQKFTLSKDQTSLISLSNPKHIYSKTSCKK